jgi:hypothetical protein
MSQASDYIENEILDHVLGNGAFTSPAALFVRLYTSATSDSGGGTEVTGGSYAATACTFGASTTNGVVTTSGTVTFPTATAGWGTVTHLAIYDAATGGNQISHGALDVSKTVTTNDTFEISAGQLTQTVSGTASDYLEQKVSDHIFSEGARTYTPATNIYVAMFSALPTDAGSYTELTATGSYARADATADFANAVSGTSTNDVSIDFPTATANWNATATHYGILDASSSGNLLFWDALDENKTVTNGDTLKFPIGDISITLA